MEKTPLEIDALCCHCHCVAFAFNLLVQSQPNEPILTNDSTINGHFVIILNFSWKGFFKDFFLQHVFFKKN
jgi:hypothetical protein